MVRIPRIPRAPVHQRRCDEEPRGCCDGHWSGRGASRTPLPDPPPQGGREFFCRWSAIMSVKIKRSVYADMFGPTTGDRVRLADTDLIIEVHKDLTIYGEEVKFGGGKVIR